jgi:hypothetical protein
VHQCQCHTSLCVEGLQSSSGHSSISCLPGPRIRPPGSCRGPFFRPAPPRFRKHPPVIRRRELATTQDPRGSGVCGEKEKRRGKKKTRKNHGTDTSDKTTDLKTRKPCLDGNAGFFSPVFLLQIGWNARRAMALFMHVPYRAVYTVIANNLKMPQSRSSELVHSRPNHRLPRFFRGTSRTSRPTCGFCGKHAKRVSARVADPACRSHTRTGPLLMEHFSWAVPLARTAAPPTRSLVWCIALLGLPPTNPRLCLSAERDIFRSCFLCLHPSPAVSLALAVSLPVVAFLFPPSVARPKLEFPTPRASLANWN